MPAGRPKAITEIKVRKLEEAFALGCTDVEACLFADVKSRTLYDYLKAHPDFSQRKAELKKTPVLLARTMVVKDIQTDSALALKFLERRQKSEFAPLTRTELSGRVKIELTDEDLDRELGEFDSIESAKTKKIRITEGKDKA